MSKEKTDIESRLRDALINSDLSRYRISQLSGVSEAQLSLFVNNKRTLTLSSAAKVAEALKLELKPIKRKAR